MDSSSASSTESRLSTFPEWCSCWKNSDGRQGATDCVNSRKCYYCDVRYCILTNQGILQTCKECEQYHGLTKPMYLRIKAQDHRIAELVSLTETLRVEIEKLKNVQPKRAEANILGL